MTSVQAGNHADKRLFYRNLLVWVELNVAITQKHRFSSIFMPHNLTITTMKTASKTKARHYANPYGWCGTIIA
jgi:hypothetical protein